MYASPEVAAYEVHGRASDLFSLGCMLLELVTVYSGLTIESPKNYIQFENLVTSYEPHFYHNSLNRVRSWISTLDDLEVSNKTILNMLQENPEDRPTLVGQGGVTNVIDLECLHHHDPNDLLEAGAGSTFIDSGIGPDT
jgi:serine/threonine protein kinase